MKVGWIVRCMCVFGGCVCVGGGGWGGDCSVGSRGHLKMMTMPR